MTFQIGERVRTIVVSREGEPTDRTVLATLLNYNPGDDTWDLQVVNNSSKTNLVSKKAVHVPSRLIQKIAKPDDVRVLTNKGVDPTKARQVLEIVEGDLQSAIDLLLPSAKKSSIIFPGERREPSETPPNLYAKTLPTRNVAPEYPYQPIKSESIYNYEALRTRQKYDIGETVETRIVFGKRSKREVWVTARIAKYNVEDNTWDIEVLEPLRHRVHPVAIHVPDHYVRKYVRAYADQGFPVGGVALVYESESDIGIELPVDPPSPSDARPPPPRTPPPPSLSYPPETVEEAKISSMLAAGFTRDVAVEALKAAMGDVDFALSLLIETNQSPDRDATTTKAPETWSTPTTPVRQGSEPKADEFDYQMLFPPPRFGFEIVSGKGGRSALVGACLSDFAIDNVIPGSLVISVQDVYVIGMQIGKIQALMKKSMEEESRVKLRLRSKKKSKQEFQRQGTLKIIVVSGQALFKAATHCTVHIRNSVLTSDKVKKDKNPIWNSALRWREFHPSRIRKALLKVWCANTITSNTCIGSAIFSLPNECDLLCNTVVEIKQGKKEKIRGLVALKMLIQST